MTHAQFQLRFRQSFAGLLWAVVPPLATLGVAALVFHSVVHVDTGKTSYAVFAMAALTPWTFFANSLMFGVPSVVGNMHLVVRLPFPRAALPLSMIGASLIDLGISAAIFVVFAYTMGNGLGLAALWFPVLVLIELALVVGIVLLASALNVFARDVRLAIPVLVQLWLFLTPVMYSLATVPGRLRFWYVANPMTGVVESFRRILVTDRSPDASVLVPAIVGAAVVLVAGTWYFSASERRFADVI